MKNELFRGWMHNPQSGLNMNNVERRNEMLICRASNVHAGA